MNQTTKILIRTDASVQIGTGHVMRCLTLADELRGRGAEVIFVCREFDGNLCDYIEEKGYVVHRLPVSNEQGHNIEGNLKHAAWLGADWQTDARQVEEIIKSFEIAPDWLVADHYALDERWEGYLWPYYKKIMVIDDLADRVHDCDLLLDQNFYENLESRYDDLVPSGCKKLLGPKYALLRPEFREARKKLRKRDGHVKRIMVFCGGSDPTNEMLKVLKVIKGLKQPDIAVDIVIGMCNLHRESIENFVASMSNVRCHINVNNMVKLMDRADLFIGSAGITTWERCCLGLPSLVITIAENQEKATTDLADIEVLHYLGKSEQTSNDDIANMFDYYLCHPSLLVNYSKASMKLVDGNGVSRCVALLNEQPPLRDIVIIPFTERHVKRTFQWVKNPELQRLFLMREEPKITIHHAYFERVLKDHTQKLYAIVFEGRHIGNCGIKNIKLAEKEGELWIYIGDPELWGKGIGKYSTNLLIREGLEMLGLKMVCVHVAELNMVAIKMYEKLGFVIDEGQGLSSEWKNRNCRVIRMELKATL